MPNQNDFINFLDTDSDKENEMNESVMQKMHRYWVLAGLRQSKENLQQDYAKKDNNYKEYKRQLRYLRLQIILHYLKNAFLFPIWFIKILTPSFFKGTPNIWTNLKLISTKKEFHPLRMAMLSWLAFSYMLVQGGVFYFRHAPRAEAFTYSWVQTDWSGNPDGGVSATHADNRTGWTQYSAVSNLYTSSTGQISLATSTYTVTDGTTFATTGDDTGGDFDSGTNVNTDVSGINVQLAIASQTMVNAWDTPLSVVPTAANYNSQIIHNGSEDAIYLVPVDNSTSFYKYSISGNTWTTLAAIPAAADYGTRIIRNGTEDAIYLARGQNKDFYKYSISGNTWTTLTSMTGFGMVGNGSQMIRNGSDDYIYLLWGDGSTNFRRYSISGNTWTTLAYAYNTFFTGAILIRNGSDNNIYATRGYGSNEFYTYSISANIWTTLSPVPGTVSAGSQMIRNSSSDTIYLVSGNNSTNFYSYSISANTWTTLATVPGNVGVGSGMTRNASDDTIYLAQGANLTGFYSYSISANTWTTLDVAPANIGSGCMIRISDSSGVYIYLAQGSSSTGFYRFKISEPAIYQPSGTFTSNVIDVGALEFDSLSFTSSTVEVGALPVRFQIATNNDNTTWNYVGPDGTVGTYFTNQSGEAIDVGNDGSRYLKYKIYLQTSDTANTPTVSAVAVGYKAYSPSGTLVSTAFDTGSLAGNAISSISWTEDLNASGDIKYQLKTAATAEGLAGAFFLGPDGSNATYFTDSTGGEAMPAVFADGVDDQFFQYQATLTTSNGVVTPVLSDVTIAYEINTTPQISGSGVTASQNANGTVTIVYSAYDPDGTVVLGDVDGLTTPSFQYSLDGLTTSTIVSGLTESGYATATTTRDIGSAWVTSTVIWTPKNEIDGQYTAAAQIKVIIDDGEAASNTVSSTSSSFVLDVKNPVPASPAIYVVATTTPATLTLSATDDNSMQMATSLDSAMSGATWKTYSTADTITLGVDTGIIYAQFRDSFANTSTIQSVVMPGKPSNVIFRDISNLNTSEFKEFITWSAIALPTPGFSRYDIYRSTNGSDYSFLASVGNRLTNYYLDENLSNGTTYYYKLASVDSNGNTSAFSSVVSDAADGQGGSDVVPPVISSVATSNVTTQGFTVTWNTDEISSSSVAYSALAFGPSFSTSTLNTMTDSPAGILGQHSLTISGLTPNTGYFFQVASGDPSGNTSYDNNSATGYSVTTLDGAILSGVAVSSVDNTQATVTWNSNIPVNSTVYYSTSDTMAGASNVTSADLVTVHSINITGLTLNTRYYFYVTSGMATDNNSGAYYTFTTTNDTTSPTISNVTASPVADTTAVINWETNEGATSQVIYGEVSGALDTYSALSTGLNVNHTVLLDSLTSQKTYYYKVASIDGSNNITTSTERNFTTSQTLLEESAVVVREVAAGATVAVGGGGGGFANVPTEKIPPVISGIRVSNITSQNATIEWKTDEEGNTAVEYGKDEKYDHYYFNYDDFVTNHAVTLANLTPGTKYNYRVNTFDKLGNRAYSQNQTFSTVSGFEEIDTLQQFNPQQTVAEGTPESVFYSLIGKTADIIKGLSGQVSPGTLEYALTVQYATIKELGKLIPLPLIGGQPVVEVGGSYARIFWTTDKQANSLVAFAADSTYKNNQEYTQVVGNADVFVDNHEVLLSELKPNTLYHYQVRSKTPISDTAKSRDFIFETQEEKIEIIIYSIERVSDTEAIFSWTTNVPSDSKVTYIPYGQDGSIMIDSLKSVYDKNIVTNHSVSVTSLEGGQVYQVELSSKDTKENIVSKTISTFSTSEIDSPAVITQVQTDTALIPGEKVLIQAIISWLTNEPSTSQVFYQKGFGKTDGTTEFNQKSAFDPNFVKKHVIVITNFDPGAVYQFQAESTDSSRNVTRSKTYTILTPRQKESIFQVITNSLEDTFSWVGKLGL